MVSSVGRPAEHGEQTRAALRDAAERLFEQYGSAGVTVRALAEEAGTTTRAVYTLFGSLDGLVVDALGQHAYELLAAALDAHPETDDPVSDLIDMAPSVFRRFVRDHPALYRIAFQRAVPNFEPGPELLAARSTGFERLTGKVQRLETIGMLQQKPLAQAVVEFQAMCEGLANFEVRGSVMPMLWDTEDDTIWTTAFTNVIGGFG
jgi:AcrR family transcriptional regulator